MAIRHSRDDSFQINGSLEGVFNLCCSALQRGKFTSISANHTIHQIQANYHKFTVWGKIEVTVLEKAENVITVNTHTTANIDNFFALLSSPIDKIANAFKDAIRMESAQGHFQ